MKWQAVLKYLICSGLMVAYAQCALSDDHHVGSASFTQAQVTQHVILLQGKGGNVALLKSADGLLMVDNDYKEVSDALKKALGQHGGIERLKYVINTHWHGDHTQNNLLVGKHADIVAHHNVRRRLSQPGEVKFFNMKSDGYPDEALPSITYAESLSLYLNRQHIEILHFPGSHTDGDSIVWFKNENVLHLGDLFFNGFFPFVDLDSGGNVIGLADSVASILKLADRDTHIIPGHGPLTDKAGLEAYHAMLIGSIKEVRAMKKRGQSLKDMQDAGLSARWDSWTTGFISTDAWIGFVYASLWPAEKG